MAVYITILYNNRHDTHKNQEYLDSRLNYSHAYMPFTQHECKLILGAPNLVQDCSLKNGSFSVLLAIL